MYGHCPFANILVISYVTRHTSFVSSHCVASGELDIIYTFYVSSYCHCCQVVESVAREFGLLFSVYRDSPPPSTRYTLELFHSAVLVVGPHGAGLSNIVFSQPDTIVVEITCPAPSTALCFQALAYVLGQRWHGLASRGPKSFRFNKCKWVDNVSVPSNHLNTTLRKLLRNWNKTSTVLIK